MLTTETWRVRGGSIARTSIPTIPAKFASIAALEAWLADAGGDGNGLAGVFIGYGEADVDRPIRLDFAAAREVISSSPGTTAWQLLGVSIVDNGGPSGRSVLLERLGVGSFTHADDAGVVFTAAEAGDANGSGFRLPTSSVITTDDGVADARNGRALQEVTPAIGPASIAFYDVGPFAGVVLLLACESTDTVRAFARRWA